MSSVVLVTVRAFPLPPPCKGQISPYNRRRAAANTFRDCKDNELLRQRKSRGGAGSASFEGYSVGLAKWAHTLGGMEPAPACVKSVIGKVVGYCL